MAVHGGGALQVERMLDPFSPDALAEGEEDMAGSRRASGGGASSSGRGGGGGSSSKPKKPRYFKGRCWMASDFPMSLRQLLPLLDVVGHANKHVAKVRWERTTAITNSLWNNLPPWHPHAGMRHAILADYSLLLRPATPGTPDTSPHCLPPPSPPQVAKFMSKYGDMQQFPVKVQVPLLFTVYALLAFKKFKPLGAKDKDEDVGEDFFTVPEGYT